MIVGYRVRSYDQVAIELLNALQTTHGNPNNTADGIAEQLSQYFEAASLWPSDAEVKQVVLGRHLPQYAQRLAFSAIEQRLITSWAGMADLVPNVQIEHIMPQGWQAESWPLPDYVEPTLAVARREQVIETLGNLTLLNGRLNSSISNASWNVKRSAIQESDNLFLNRRLLNESSNEWTEDDITRRGE